NAKSLREIDSAVQCVRQCFVVARNDVEEAADREGIDRRQLATTLLTVVVGSEYVVFAQVGDGAVVWGEPGALRIAHWPEQAALNLTDFLTSAPLEESLHVTIQ